jgi:predicted amidohydrolase YtcJ
VTTTLYHRGRVRTPADPFATALLVEDDVVAWVGSDAAATALSADVTVDLDDAWVAPAFVDAHVHSTTTGLALTGLDLASAPSLAVLLSRVEQASRAVRGGVVLGTGWEEDGWPERRPPTAAELDRASHGGVVYLARTDVHSAVASSALLAVVPEARRLDGWSRRRLVKEQAHSACGGRLRRPAARQRRDAQRRSPARRVAGHRLPARVRRPGIDGAEDFAAAGAGAAEPGTAGSATGPSWPPTAGSSTPGSSGRTAPGGDLFVDGSLGSHTACLGERYADVDTLGYSYLDAGQVADHVAACSRRGAGRLPRHRRRGADRRAGRLRGGRRPGRAGRPAGRPAPGRARRAAHGPARPGDGRPRAGRQRAAGLRRPVGRPGGLYEQRLGVERTRASNPLGVLAAAGVPLALGSDSPVTPLDPWGAVRAAVRHHTPSSRLSARAAFAAHTRGGWRAARVEGPASWPPERRPPSRSGSCPTSWSCRPRTSRVAAWSTDPRAGVAGCRTCPTDPSCRSPVVDGRPVWDAADPARR